MIAIIHIIVCMVIYIGIRAGFLKTDRGLLPVVFLVPFWGALGALMMHLEVVRGHSGSDAGRLEVMRRGQEEETEPLLNREEEEVVVPLEEALIINPPSVRRGLMMDVLMEDIGDDISILNQARGNEDAEVVHYATTAMAELAKDYDLRLQKMEIRYRDDPENEEILEEYLKLLKEYIDSGIVQGSFLRLQKHQCQNMLCEKIRRQGSLCDYRSLVQGYLDLGELEEAKRWLDEMEKRWPAEEAVWILKVEYCFKLGQGEIIQKLLEEIERRKIYLSAEGKEKLEFLKK